MEPKEIDIWKSSIGFGAIRRPQDDFLTKILECDGKYLSHTDTAELEEVMIGLSNYYSFLQLQLGEIGAKVNYLSELLDRESNSYAVKCGRTGHFLERKSLAVIFNEEIKKVSDTLSTHKVKFDMLKPIAEGVRNKLDSVRRIHDRRIRVR